ncbi:MAG: three-Cys-motif partner protein TcmP [bacterium]|nr:three-Cys-motif partner protein TcmP [bacterium]
MPRRPYQWEQGGRPPPIEAHSRAKHAILDRYVERYIEVLCALPQRESIHLTLVDGFAGGGLYWNNDEQALHPGSPLIMLDAVERAERVVNERRMAQGQRTLLRVKAEFFFVDINKGNVECLKKVLAESRFADRVGEDVHVLAGAFESHAERIISRAEGSSRAGRSLFLLDQYGYKDVPVPLLQKILGRLPNAELLVTFAVDSLTQYLSEKNLESHKRVFDEVGLSGLVDLEGALEERSQEHGWRWLIQHQLAGALRKGSGAAYMTPFFNVSETSHRAYWLVHLCQSQRANMEMKALHWEFANHFRHYGAAGLDMLGYDPTRDDDLVGQIQLGYDFDIPARKRSIGQLVAELPNRLTSEGVAYTSLFESVTNETPASDAMIREVLDALMSERLVEARSSDSGFRRSAARIKSTDAIALPSQRVFSFPGGSRKS